jgi:hypothetical protein
MVPLPATRRRYRRRSQPRYGGRKKGECWRGTAICRRARRGQDLVSCLRLSVLSRGIRAAVADAERIASAFEGDRRDTRARQGSLGSSPFYFCAARQTGRTATPPNPRRCVSSHPDEMFPGLLAPFGCTHPSLASLVGQKAEPVPYTPATYAFHRYGRTDRASAMPATV